MKYPRSAPGVASACVMPSASPAGRAVLGYPFTVVLATSPVGATMEYQIRNLGEAAGATWSTCTGPVTIPGDRTLYARASKAGLGDSPVMQEDYWREREDHLPPGWQPL